MDVRSQGGLGSERTVYGLHADLSRALKEAADREAPDFVTRRLVVALYFVEGMLRRGEELVRPDVVDLVEDAMDRYSRWKSVIRR